MEWVRSAWEWLVGQTPPRDILDILSGNGALVYIGLFGFLAWQTYRYIVRIRKMKRENPNGFDQYLNFDSQYDAEMDDTIPDGRWRGEPFEPTPRRLTRREPGPWSRNATASRLHGNDEEPPA